MTDRIMEVSEFVELLDVHGSTVDSWPVSARTAAQNLLQVSSEAQIVLANQVKLESTLAQLAVPEFPGLVQKISNQALPPRKLSLLDQLIEWLIPRRSPGLWRPAMAACLPLIFGILLGNYYSFGISENQLADEDWSDELYILALNEYDQGL